MSFIHVDLVAQWFLGELDQFITARKEELENMHRLGTNGIALAAHREATNDLAKAIDRWRQETTIVLDGVRSPL